MSHYRTQINNIANKYRLNLKYEEVTVGPQHAPTWIVTLLINEIEYGRAQGASRGGAREVAAEAAVIALREYGYV